MKSLFPGAAAAIATLVLASAAQAAGSYPSPIFANVTIANCSNGYLKPQGLTPASCISAIPGADLAAGAAVANLGFTPLGPSDMGTSGHKVPYLDGMNSWSANQTISLAWPTLYLNKLASGSGAQLVGQTNGIGRWNMVLGDSAAESGSNAGSDFQLVRYSDAGAALSGNPLGVQRSSGNIRTPAGNYFTWGAAYGSSGYGFRDNAGAMEAKNSGGSWLPILTTGYIGTSGHVLGYLDGANTWSGANTYTSPPKISIANFPTLSFYDSAGGADLKNWDVFAPSGGFVIRAVNDAYSAANTAFGCYRGTGYSVASCGIGAPIFTLIANGYLNFGVADGSSGYGIRDNGGSVQAKDSGGAWKHVATESLTAAGDANYTILATDDHVYHSALTAARTDTLPAANSVKAGHAIRVQDVLGVASATNTIGVQRSGSDTINGVNSVVAVNSAYGGTTFVSDGVSKWSYVPPQTGALACANLPAGAWCLLNTLTASSSASLADTTSFTPTYAHYEIYLDNIMPATATASCIFRVYSGGAFQNSNYVTLMYHGNTGGAASIAPTNGIPCNAQVGTMASPGVSLHLHVYKPTATGSKVFNGSEGSSIQAGGAIETFYALNGYWAGGTGAITGFDVYFSSGNIASGEIRVYGHN